MPEMTNGTTSAQYATVGVDTRPSQARPIAWSVRPDAHQQAAADAIGQRARDGRHEHRCERPGQDGRRPAWRGE